jgi:hypothetical protein
MWVRSLLIIWRSEEDEDWVELNDDDVLNLSDDDDDDSLDLNGE